MNNFKPSNSAGLTIIGAILGWIIGPAILAFAVPAAISASITASLSRSFYATADSTPGAFVFLGVLVVAVGQIMVLTGLGFALRTVDYLGRKFAPEQAKPATPADLG
ncbi:hypothetical protein [Sinomonas atrocyanea]